MPFHFIGDTHVMSIFCLPLHVPVYTTGNDRHHYEGHNQCSTGGDDEEDVTFFFYRKTIQVFSESSSNI